MSDGLLPFLLCQQIMFITHKVSSCSTVEPSPQHCDSVGERSGCTISHSGTVAVLPTGDIVGYLGRDLVRGTKYPARN